MGALAKPAHLRSALAMVRNAIPWKMRENRPDWPAITLLGDESANVDVPRLIAWGEWGEKWKTGHTSASIHGKSASGSRLVT
jgi:hypothetical protein